MDIPPNILEKSPAAYSLTGAAVIPAAQLTNTESATKLPAAGSVEPEVRAGVLVRINGPGLLKTCSPDAVTIASA